MARHKTFDSMTPSSIRYLPHEYYICLRRMESVLMPESGPTGEKLDPVPVLDSGFMSNGTWESIRTKPWNINSNERASCFPQHVRIPIVRMSRIFLIQVASL